MSFEEHTSTFFDSSCDGKYSLFQYSIALLCDIVRLQEKQATTLSSWCVCRTIIMVRTSYAFASMSKRIVQMLSAFCLSMKQDIKPRINWFNDMCANLQHVQQLFMQPMNMHSSVALQGQFMCSMASMLFFLKYEHRGISHYPSQSVSLTAL